MCRTSSKPSAPQHHLDIPAATHGCEVAARGIALLVGRLGIGLQHTHGHSLHIKAQQHLRWRLLRAWSCIGHIHRKLVVADQPRRNPQHQRHIALLNLLDHPKLLVSLPCCLARRHAGHRADRQQQ